MSLFAFGDPHLSLDPSVQKPMDIFGPSWNHHAERLRLQWDQNIHEEDTVIIAGDISWGLKLEQAMADLNFLSGRPGRKILIRGNHDLWWSRINRLNRLYDNMVFLQNSCCEAEDWFICGSRGWICPGAEDFDLHDEKIYKRELLRMEMSLQAAKNRRAERIIAVSHFPPTNDKKQASAFTQLYTEYHVDTVLYGHLHGQEAFKKGLQGKFCGVNYQLVSLDYLHCIPKKIK